MVFVKRLIFVLVFVPFGLGLVSLSVANRQLVTLALDPFSPQDPSISITVPLFICLFVTLIIGIGLGGMASWFKQHKWRKQARLKRYEAARWRHEADEQRSEIDQLKQVSAQPILSGSSVPQDQKKNVG
ncbi:MAG: DUF1049 domain-containing protein [Cohaesibacteraceae bacterium]|nr:DUF1049 domain-containing protein [Cohaesibacteraceae bacterium]